jgi:NlpC/P60 family putative phage cell wall peptidase
VIIEANLEAEELQFRKQIVETARLWLKTPFQHQGSVCGQGSDCLGLVRGVWRDVVGVEPELCPTYAPDMVQLKGDVVLMEALTQHFHQVEIDLSAIGDVVAFRLSPEASAQHLGITLGNVGGFPRIIHSYNRIGVVEGPLGGRWLRRCVGQFKFPRRIK